MNDLRAYLLHRDALAGLLDPRRYTVEWLDKQVATGALMVWGDDRAVILAELRHYPTGAVDIHGMAAAGDLKAIQAHIRTAEGWAKEHGCIGAEIASRGGWARVLKDYAVHQVIIRKDLTDGA